MLICDSLSASTVCSITMLLLHGYSIQNLISEGGAQGRQTMISRLLRLKWLYTLLPVSLLDLEQLFHME